MKFKIILLALLMPILLSCQSTSINSIWTDVQHGFADNDGVKIHYAAIGEGDLVIMLHGFPDFWYTWRDQMEALKNDFQLIAVDLRGYNKSSSPEGIENYKMNLLMEDVIAVIHHFKKKKAIIVGHDWGGAIGWQLAIQHPEAVEKLVTLNITHPTGSAKETIKKLKENGNQSYQDGFMDPEAPKKFNPQWLSGWVTDTDAKAKYLEAFERSNVKSMLNYYLANMPTKEQRAVWIESGNIPEFPKVQAPVLMIFGTKDQYIPKGGLNNTWDWVAKDLTMVTIPDAGHFVQQDAPDLVTRSLKMWLLRDK